MSDESTSAAASGAHLTVQKTFATGEAGNTLTLSYQGPYADLLDLVNSIAFFESYSGDGAEDFPEGNSTTSGAGWSYPFASRAIIRRGNGDVSMLDLTVQQVRLAGIWGLDFAEVSKPILSWRPPTGDEPNVQLVKQWMKLGEENPASPDYNSFKVEGVSLSGSTLTLAQKIYAGVETYSVYAPVVTWQCRLFGPPDVTLYPVGVQMSEISAPHDIGELGSKDFESTLNGLSDPQSGEPYVWVRSASKVSTNTDGTFTWFMQWQAVNAADADLYPEET